MKKIAVICHDAGGAELISSWLEHNRRDFFVYLDGPAKKIFKKKFNNLKFVSLNDIYQSFDEVLLGSSWQSNLEKHVINKCVKMQIKTIVFLDHWVNYMERFLYNGKVTVPDEIWVSDKYAYKIAYALFENSKIILKKNYYLNHEVEKTKNLSSNKNYFPCALYVCEPIKEHALKQSGNSREWGYEENDALKYFIDNLSVLDKAVQKIIIRPHPSESIKKYDWVLNYKQVKIPIFIGGKKSLCEEISESQVIIGCESMAMVIGLMSGKKIITSIPPYGRPCMLPYKDIYTIEQLIQKVE